MQELSRIQHGEYALEEKVKSCRCAMEEKVAEMKNSLNTFKVGAQLAGGCTPATSAQVAWSFSLPPSTFPTLKENERAVVSDVSAAVPLALHLPSRTLTQV